MGVVISLGTGPLYRGGFGGSLHQLGRGIAVVNCGTRYRHMITLKVTIFAIQLLNFKLPITTEYPLIKILEYKGKEWAKMD